MRESAHLKSIVFKYILPIAALMVIIGGILFHRGNINAEIPFDQDPDPWPLRKECPAP